MISSSSSNHSTPSDLRITVSKYGPGDDYRSELVGEPSSPTTKVLLDDVYLVEIEEWDVDRKDNDMYRYLDDPDREFEIAKGAVTGISGAFFLGGGKERENTSPGPSGVAHAREARRIRPGVIRLWLWHECEQALYNFLVDTGQVTRDPDPDPQVAY